jgi:type I pantothenate kinase
MTAWAPPPFEVHEGSTAALTEIVRQRLDARATSVPAPTGPFVIGVAGGVAAGKSTFAGELGEQVGGAQVIGTDGFLFPNTTLNARGLLSRKGFPESYDTELAADVLRRITEGQTDVAIPRYSHTTYDIDGPPQVVRQPNVLVVEGVNALQPPFAGYSSLRIYLDADEPDLRRWYADRFVALVQQGEGFYARWTGVPEDEVRSLATMTWEYVNLPNLTEHILPTRWTADVVVRKAADHTIAAIAVRPRGGG